MGASHTQLYVHAAFAVKDKRVPISSSFRQQLYQYITYLFKLEDQHLIAIGGTQDHVHVLFRMTPTKAVADLMRDIKALSSRHVNDKQLSAKPFYWENGYVAFTCTRAQVERIVPLLQQQKAYHTHHTFKEEILEIMGELNIHFDEAPEMQWADALRH